MYEKYTKFRYLDCYYLDSSYRLNDNLAMNIEFELKMRNISINECAKQTGIPYGALYPIVKGQVDMNKCAYITLKKLADFLHCEIDDFFTEITDFTMYWENEKTADVHINSTTVEITRYSTHPVKQLFYKDVISRYEFGEILRTRCWDPNKDNIERNLYQLGLTSYDPFKICRKTHGVMYQDKIWFCFKGENLTWEDVRCC